MNKFIIVILMASVFSGCGMNGQYQCPKKAGVHCKSMIEISDLVDQGKLPLKTASQKSAKPLKQVDATQPAQSRLSTENPHVKNSSDEGVIIWLAPYEDKVTGLQYSDSYVHLGQKSIGQDL